MAGESICVHLEGLTKKGGRLVYCQSAKISHYSLINLASEGTRFYQDRKSYARSERQLTLPPPPQFFRGIDNQPALDLRNG